MVEPAVMLSNCFGEMIIWGRGGKRCEEVILMLGL